MDQRKASHRKAVAWTALGVAAFFGAPVVAVLAGPGSEKAAGVAGFVGLLLCVRRAMVLWDVDKRVFDHRHPPFLLIITAVISALAAASTAAAQQTIFNVPTADVLDKGKLYLETDWLWRPSDPAFASGSILRGVYGLGGNLEAGVNFAGIVRPGRSTPVAVPNVKWQPLKTEAFSLTTGVFGQFFLRGARDGTPSVMGYAHAAVKLPIGTRLTAGAWWASSGFAGPGVEKGGLFGLEQPITPNVTLAADWYTGHNGLGFASPGVIVTAGCWVLYISYSFKNGNSKGSGILLEFGFNMP